MANKIRVIGVGPGNPEYTTPIAIGAIKSADVLVGGERVLANFKDLGKEMFVVRSNLRETVDFIRARFQECVVAVLASGDPAFYGVLEYLKRNFAKEDLMVLPGLSSIQLACARLCISWHDASFFSVHGREFDGLADLVKARDKVIVLTDPVKTPAVIARALMDMGVNNRKLYVCENLSYEDEFIGGYFINEVPDDAGNAGCVLVISDE